MNSKYKILYSLNMQYIKNGIKKILRHVGLETNKKNRRSSLHGVLSNLKKMVFHQVLSSTLVRHLVHGHVHVQKYFRMHNISLSNL